MAGSSGDGPWMKSGDASRATRASRLRDHLRVILIAGIAVLGTMAAVLAWRSYDATFYLYLARMEADVALMARDVERLVHSADLLLVQMVDLARDTDWSNLDARGRADEELRHLGGLLPESFRLQIFDAQGNVRATSVDEMVTANVAERGYFREHRAGKTGLHLSGLMQDLYNMTPMFTMSRRVPGSDGGFDGVVAVSFEPRIIGEVYRSFAATAEGLAFIWAHADGRVLVREPSRSGSPKVGETLATGLVAALGMAAADGSSLRAVLPDGIRYLVEVRQVGAYPFHVVVGTPMAVIARAGADGMVPYVVGSAIALFALAVGARRGLAWAEAEDRYRERLARLLAEKDILLEQKELLMREVDHRVKNSLQIVTNLLDLQAGLTFDRAMRAQLAEARGRVEAVALLHRSLHQSEGPDRIDLSVYLGHLARSLAEATRAPVQFVHDARPVELPNDLALSIGLIVNELVTNALKHAYPGSTGPVHLLLRDEGTRLRLRVADAGGGLPPGFDVHAEGNLGMRIVRMLVESLGGVLRAEPLDPGTAFEIVLPRSDAASNHSVAAGSDPPPDPSGSKRTTTSSSNAAQ